MGVLRRLELGETIVAILMGTAASGCATAVTTTREDATERGSSDTAAPEGTSTGVTATGMNLLHDSGVRADDVSDVNSVRAGETARGETTFDVELPTDTVEQGLQTSRDSVESVGALETEPFGAQMLSAVIDGQSYEFSEDMLTYNGRPPMMDIYARSGSETGAWFSLRVAVSPTSTSAIVPGEYACGPEKTTFVMLSGAGGVFDSTTLGPCRVVVDSPGTASGEVFSGSFEATLYTTDGARAVVLEHGRFYGVVP